MRLARPPGRAPTQRATVPQEQRYEIGSFGAKVLSHLDRVACVIPRALYTGHAERPAQKQGLRVQSFADLEPAMKWVAG